ncbi:site-specific integrase [Bacillus atrophaeus]|uniref:site-specific integrase n=1 Tax=Bacillus atrophaeus TaxID=1452 RepID=UPI00227E06E5|nr:site-specific integrase [Bacillus atrophaeus]MCY8920233.1 site-specific integrase [Bacillus atrophaeus]
MIKDNPRQRLSSPEAEDKEMNFLQSEETAEYIKVLYEIDIKWRLFYLAALMGGLIRGEALACEWHLDVDWDKDGIYVNRSISKTIDGEPMSKVQSQEALYALLKCLIFIWMSWLNITAYGKKKNCCLAMPGKAEIIKIYFTVVKESLTTIQPPAQWAKTKKMYGLKDVRLHDLRHTMVALLMEAGESLSAIQRRAGHASARTTSDIYGHVSKKLENSTVKHFNHFDHRNPA